MNPLTNWKSYVRGNTLEWLLEDNNPSVRYFALIDLLDKRSNSSEVRCAKAKIMTDGSVPEILNKQKPGGYWEDPDRFYLPKFKSTFWTFFLLAELSADGDDKRIKQTCNYILSHSKDKTSGAFSFRSGKNGGGDHEKVVPCLTGIMLFSLIRFGYLDDPRIQEGINWIVRYQRFDDGIEKAPRGWPYSAGNRKGESCWGKHTCFDGVVGCLMALSEIPKTQRSKEVKRTIEQASEYMLKHHIYKRSHDLSQIANPRWIMLGFPFRFDFLQVLFILSELGYHDNRMQDALDLLLSKQNENGRWLLEKAHNRMLQTNIEYRAMESKWITLNALRSLKNCYP
jgi:hypothetical protein